MKNKLIRNFPVALILASSSLFTGNNQNTYAEGIMSATPTTVVVAELLMNLMLHGGSQNINPLSKICLQML